MNPKRYIKCATLGAIVAAALPASAFAGAGQGDDINDAIAPPGNGVLPLSTARSPHILGFEVDTSAYGIEPGEPTSCNTSGTSYGKTVWGTFKAPQFGRLDVTAAGFDSVITLFDASLKGGPRVKCTDRLAGKIESYPRDSLPTVEKNHTYYVQVGGAVQPDGSIPGGDLSVDLELIRPEVTVGDAVLTWRGVRGGVRISSLKVDGPSGSFVTVGCLKRSCGKGIVTRGKAVLKQPIGTVGLPARFQAKPVAEPNNDFTVGKPVVRAAAKSVFKGKKVKNGDTLFVAVQAKDQIGEIFFWHVKKGLAGTKNVGCIEPNSSKIKRVGACKGR